MEKASDSMFLLQQHTKNLHNVSGQFNLYICLCNKKCTADTKRIKRQIEKIKQFVLNIESEIETIEIVNSNSHTEIELEKNLGI